ncbi:wiskott-Aldrich syndrome protein homolog [Acanthopagrus latus]|uniref:wiskott-Aldrich syndrome protein homolog n=1 Tax=Acanthopagrus latus TaxID=8177 RepID=UPI00187C359F|nr:wiskott-Aldrich syndrome protein homolog [Acanthopagrus latus]
MSESPRLQPPTATRTTVRQPRLHATGSTQEGEPGGSRSGAVDPHRKQTGPLTSTGVPSPPLSHGVSSPGRGGIPTGGDPRPDTGATRSTPLSICARTAAPPPPPPAVGPC